ncbi:unnamed protein product, partial [Cochlearia groenlandica]
MTLNDGTGGAIRDLAGLIKSTNPIALVIAEQEAEHDLSQLEMRVSVKSGEPNACDVDNDSEKTISDEEEEESDTFRIR